MDTDPLPNGDSASTATSVAMLTPTYSVTAVVPSSKSKRLADSLKLEHQLMRVPLEHYKKTIRSNHRIAEKELSSVIAGVGEAVKMDMSKDEAVDHLKSLVSRLQGLKRKLEERSRNENLQSQKCKARLDYLESADSHNLSEWYNTRLKRVLVDYMLRKSYFDTAVKLAETSNLMDLVDIEVFYEAKKVIDALQNKDAGPALKWCADNKSRLKKSKSKIEFQLRLKEFIELVRAENNMRAITYARKYLAPWGATHMKELQRTFSNFGF